MIRLTPAFTRFANRSTAFRRLNANGPKVYFSTQEKREINAKEFEELKSSRKEIKDEDIDPKKTAEKDFDGVRQQEPVDVIEKTKQAMESTAEVAKEKAASTAEQTKQVTERAAKQVKENMAEKAREAKLKAQDKAPEYKEKVKETASDIWTKTKRMFGKD